MGCCKSDQLQFVNVFSANQVATLCSVPVVSVAGWEFPSSNAHDR